MKVYEFVWNDKKYICKKFIFIKKISKVTLDDLNHEELIGTELTIKTKNTTANFLICS